MATYTELYDFVSAALDKRIIAGIIIKANLIAKLTTPTAAQKAFAVEALGNPANYLATVRNYILADYNTAATSAINAATDAQVQTAVNAAVDTLLGV